MGRCETALRNKRATGETGHGLFGEAQSTAIFAGLLPVTLWGIGTRDVALVWMFADVAPAPAMAVVGMLTALRYIVPGLAGIPCLSGILGGVRGAEGRGVLAVEHS